MTTIEPYSAAFASGLAREVYTDIERTYGVKEPQLIYQLMGHTPEFLAASWRRSRHLYGTAPDDTDVSLSRFSLKEKHLMTLGVSATNNCEYCVRIHTVRLRQLGMTEQEHIELLSVVAAMSGFNKLAEGVRAGERPTLPPADEGGEAGPLLAEVRQGSGGREPDEFYLLLAHRPDLLKVLWNMAKECFIEEGALGLRTKHLVALAVAATNGADYHIRRHLERLRELGYSAEDLVELLLVVDLACGYNRYVQGLQIQPETVNTFGPRKPKPVASA